MSTTTTDILLRAKRILPHSQAEYIVDGGVAVENGLISWVGPWSARPKGLEERDLGEATLMPGMFDCHVHLQMDPGSGSISTAAFIPDETLVPLIYSNALKLLDAGVTTARDLGSRGTLLVTARDAILSGQYPGPRMQVANAPITVPGGHAHAMGGVAQGVEGVRAEVRKRITEGADVIKVMSTGGFMTAGSKPSEARYTVEELRAMVEEAHKSGIPVTTHAAGSEGIARAVEAGLDSIEHCAWVTENGAIFDPVVAQAIVDKGIAVCPTMNTACTEHTYFCPWDSRKAVIDNLSALREAGAKMIVGTDAGIGLCHYERYADGLLALSDAGYTPREIIASGTDIAAEVCGLKDVTGKVQVGLAADLLALRGDPIASGVKAFFHPTFVMARGIEHIPRPIADLDQTALDQMAGILQQLQKGAGMIKA